MPIQLMVCEHRDNADRMELGNAALAVCRSIRAKEGISSSRFYWYLTDTVVILTEGEASALDSPADAEYARAGFELADLAKLTMNLRLIDPRTGMETYQSAGR